MDLSFQTEKIKKNEKAEITVIFKNFSHLL